MKADLHIHSVYSDGVLTPSELARKARAEGLDLISITDHDNLSGEDDKRRAMEVNGLCYLCGWEISAFTDQKVHILGYGCRIEKPYEQFLEKRRTEALERTVEIIRRANQYLGLDVTLEEVERESFLPGNVLHAVYAVRAFAKRLRRNDMELYSDLFHYGKPLYVMPRRPAPQEAIDIIHELGGVAVLAHPGRMRAEGKKELFDQLVSRGIDGIECHYTTHTEAETEDYLAFARKHKLFITGGSDYHYENGRPVFGKPVYVADENFLARALSSQGGD